jgi:hypothetical protein
MNFRILQFCLILSLLILITGCGVRDLTNSATSLIQQAEDLVREIDSQVETGELEENVGNLAEDAINDLVDKLSDALQENGGMLFDSANGTIDNVFVNISSLLTQIKTGILDDSAPNLIQVISEQLQLQVNMLSGQIEDIITLTAGNVFIFVDKTTNMLVIVLSIVLLAIGLLILIVIFLKMKQGIKTSTIIGLVFACIYVIFFLSVILISPLRGWIIAGFDFGKKMEAKTMEAKIRGILPEKFVIGKNDRITIYGSNLNLVKGLSVKLFQGDSLKKAFPNSTVVVATRSKIVLGNFGSVSVGWVLPKFTMYKAQVIDTIPALANVNLTPILEGINKVSFPKIEFRTSLIQPLEISPINNPVSNPISSPVSLVLASTKWKDVAVSDLGTVTGELLYSKTLKFLKEAFKLEPGDFGVYVFSEDKRVESPQFIHIEYPPPPAPKPDIFPMSLNWTTQAVSGEQATPRLRIGFIHPEEVKTPFSIKYTPINPSGSSKTKLVSSAEISSALSYNYVDVLLSTYKPSKPGNHTFEVFVDSNNNIAESNEGNNKSNPTLSVGQYVYDATVTIQTFDPIKSYDDSEDEYRVKVDSSLNGGNRWEISISKDGEPSNSWSINKSKAYPNTKPGDRIYLHTSGYEDDGDHWYDRNDSMGEDSWNIEVREDMTKGQPSREYPFQLNASGYKILGAVRFVRKII